VSSYFHPECIGYSGKVFTNVSSENVVATGAFVKERPCIKSTTGAVMRQSLHLK